jgi:hypothetical protein
MEAGMEKRVEKTKAQIAEAVRISRSIAGALRHLGLRVAGANYETIKRAVAELGLDTTHWTGQGHRRGSTEPIVKARPLELVLVRGTRPHSKLRRRLIRAGLLAPLCDDCKLAEWRGGPIPLELDHKDGDRSNNELGNLRLLCPNCHALTPTYRGRNIGARYRR